MATFIDFGLFGYFNSLFIFLFVLVAVYAILTSMKMFGGNAAFNAIIALILAIFFASSSYASKVFLYATPWIVLLFILFLFLQLFSKFIMGEDVFLKSTTIVIIILVVVGIIFLISAGQVSKENAAAKANVTGNPVLSFPHQVGDILRQPAVLGLLAVLLVATFAVLLLAATPK